MNCSKPIKRRTIANRIITSWVIIALIFSVVGFAIGAVSHSSKPKTETLIYGRAADGKIFDGDMSVSYESEDTLFVPLGVPLDSDVQEFIYYLSKGYNMDFTFVMAIIQQESGYQPDAVSNTDDYGLMQMLIVQDQVWNRVTINRNSKKNTRYYIDEFHLLLKEEQTAAYSVEIWKRFRKWGGIPTGITQNIKDLLASREIENIFENSDFIYMLNQASGDRQILAKQLNISPFQLSYVTNSNEGEGLLFYGNVILPFIDRFPKDTELYRIMTTKPQEVSG